MLAVKYLSKEIKPMIAGAIKATVVSYEIDKDGMDAIAKLQTDEYKIQRFFVYKDWGSFDLVVDNIENGKVIQGGVVDDKYLLNYYDVEEGLTELLTLLSGYTV